MFEPVLFPDDHKRWQALRLAMRSLSMTATAEEILTRADSVLSGSASFWRKDQQKRRW